ncbi:family 43 glycosylhydrolase [Kutzneria buriramensis]|uniref:Glycosyl hydrolase family 43 n=1 Tax=Kutzneria buriramensis TaxID=1045776 RepID=A0A3E0GXP2_9PSEU|nr:family 43 glycosylhydrolase [Kutzneria buriramensis]REH29660.1 glycosyl hydrolase family 43 [Kutzneria buriramensis]
MKLFSLRRLGVVLVVMAAVLPLGGVGAGAAPHAEVDSPVREAANSLSVPNIDDVRGNLTLPTAGPTGATVSWTSSDRKVITPTGEVTRPPVGGKPANVVLTATVRLGRDSASRRFTATVTPLPPKEPLTGYGFFYFTGEGTSNGEQIYSAASKGNDPLNWTELNNGQPILKSSLGELGVRDPFVMRSPDGDKFYLLATDLKINGGRGWDAEQRTGSRSITIWESDDLVHWSRQRSAQVAPPTAGNTWAPEAFWDAKRGDYVVFWASKLYAENDLGHTGDSYNRMMYATTRDFVTFSAPQVWIDPGYSVIDSTVIQNNGTYYRFTKDERNNTSSSPCSKYILEQKATDLLDPNYDFVSECIGKATATSPGLSAGEGPTGFKSNTENKWYLFIDEYGGRGYVPFETTDLDSGKWTMSTGAHLPASPRHGTVLPVTQAELDRLTAPPAPVKADRDGLVAHWPLDAKSGQVAADTTGHGYDGALAGDVTWSDGALAFGGTNGHVQLPNNMLTGASAATVSADVLVDPKQQTPYFLYSFGNTAPSGAGDGYLFATGGTADGGLRGAIASGNWATEQQAASSGALPRGVWKNLTLTVGNGVEVLYLDGIEVGRNNNATIKPSDIGGGLTAANYLGRSAYAADNYFTGKMKDVRLYDKALSGDEVAALPSNSTAVRSVDLASLKAPAVIDSTAGTVVLPVKPGTDLHRLAPKFGLAPGSRIEPANGRTVDLSRPKKFTVTGSEGRSRVWTVEAHEMRSPVLPGLNADPNIVAFGDTYYIYPTTDGFPGWGGTTFSAWSSKDLVNWTNRGVVLDLGPGVSWADKNAWAPTIAARNGKYYFYFCAEAKIGVAVGDSPVGPFKDTGRPLIASNPNGGQAIDPAVFIDHSGQPYLYWGNGNAYVVPLNDDMVSFDPAKVTHITGLDGFREGLFMVERKGTYYLSWSIDDTGSPNYSVGYGTASSPTGPFANHGVILSKDTKLGILGTGHSSMLQVPGTDDWYIAYHRFAIPGGDGTHRETTIDKMTFNPDGTIAPIKPTLESVAPEWVPQHHCGRTRYF